MKQFNGTQDTALPLLDCVLDFRVAFGLNTAGNAPDVDCVVVTPVDNTAAYLRSHLRDIRISVLSHEGARDPKFQYPASTIFVGDNTTATPRGDDVDVSALRNYRWRLHKIVVRPSSLR